MGQAKAGCVGRSWTSEKLLCGLQVQGDSAKQYITVPLLAKIYIEKSDEIIEKLLLSLTDGEGSSKYLEM